MLSCALSTAGVLRLNRLVLALEPVFITGPPPGSCRHGEIAFLFVRRCIAFTAANCRALARGLSLLWREPLTNILQPASPLDLTRELHMAFTGHWEACPPLSSNSELPTAKLCCPDIVVRHAITVPMTFMPHFNSELHRIVRNMPYLEKAWLSTTCHTAAELALASGISSASDAATGVVTAERFALACAVGQQGTATCNCAIEAMQEALQAGGNSGASSRA